MTCGNFIISLIEENENHPEIEQFFKEHRQATLDFAQEWQKKAEERLQMIFNDNLQLTIFHVQKCNVHNSKCTRIYLKCTIHNSKCNGIQKNLS